MCGGFNMHLSQFLEVLTIWIDYKQIMTISKYFYNIDVIFKIINNIFSLRLNITLKVLSF